jgi:peptidoglycan/LPS O-acetylase OafA/YrhL
MKDDYANLDILRATAVLLVFFCHLIMALGHLDDPLMKAWGIRQLAELGVLIFFIHTSLVLMMSLRRLEGQGNKVLRFYVRRAFRIYPLAMLTVVVALVVRIPPHFEPTYTEPTVNGVWQNLLLVQNLFHTPDIMGPMWSLPLEVQMYLALPLLYVLAIKIRSYAGAILLIVSGFAIWYIDSHGARFFGYQPVLRYAPWFFMGVSAFGLYRFTTPRVYPLLYGPCVLLLTMTPCLTNRLMGDDYRAGWVLWAAGVSFALALPHFLEVRSGLITRGAHAIATYSYGIYLSHVPIMWLAFHELSQQPRFVQIGIFAVLAVSVPPLLYHGLEKPLIRLGGRISDALAQTPERQTVSALA